jgi:hypothetical protein
MMARKPDEAEAGFAIGTYPQDLIEDNARNKFEDVEYNPEFREETLKAGFMDDSGEITKTGWDQLNEDVLRIEKNAMRWMKRTFLDARDEGHDDADLVGSFWYDPRDPDQAHLVDLAADTGRQERIDMVDTGFGDLGLTALDGVSDFGAHVLGGGITFFDVKPEDMEVIEDTLWRASHGGRPLQRDPRAKRPPLSPRVREAPRSPARQSDWEVIVGNIGSVYRGESSDEAVSTYREYVKQSQSGRGRAGGEPVTLFRDGEIYREHMGSNESVEERRPRRPLPPRPTPRRRPPPARRR